MSASSSCFSFPLSALVSRPVVGSFDGGRVSSDGGLLLLSQLDQKLQISARLAACIRDRRQPGKIEQTVEDMLRQRVQGICQGYEDCNDFDTLDEDPLFKTAAGRLPESGRDLASQPTLSRFENSVGPRELYRLAESIVDHFIASHPQATKIVLDFDATDDPTHGQQEFEFFHGYYGRHCYLPLLVFASVDDNTEQEILCAVLRPGNKHAGHRTVPILKRVVRRLRTAYPDVKILLRADAGFALPDVYAYCEKESLDYVLSFPKNKRLVEMAEPALARARTECAQTKQKARLFDEVSYAAETWTHNRRMVIKAEVMVEHGDNPRFLVTNIPSEQASPEALYTLYTQRGDVENRIKEMKCDLASGRTSCHRFVANQFRLILHTASMMLMQALRRLLAGTSMARLQSSILRVRLLKVGARVIQTHRRIRLSLPTSYPYQEIWDLLWQKIGAIPCRT